MKTKIEKTVNPARKSEPFIRSGGTGGFFAQARLVVGKTDDPLETEADRMAESVVGDWSQSSFLSGQPSSSVQRNSEMILRQAPEEEEEMIQAQPLEEEEEMIQAKAGGQPGLPVPAVENQVAKTRGKGTSLDFQTRSMMEDGFGADFSSISVHTDDTAVQLNRRLNAQAFATGSDIFFNEGKYNPQTRSGKKLLAHELAHTIQQGATHPAPVLQRETATSATTTESIPEPTSGETPVPSTETNSCDESTQREKEEFLSHGLYGPESLSPSATQTGGFEASYDPDIQFLNITVRGKTRFVNGLSVGGDGLVSSHESDLADLARLLNYIGDASLSNTIVSSYYTWNETQKETARSNFSDRIYETILLWQYDPGLMFYIDESCWEDITAQVNINIQVQEEGIAAYTNSSDSSNDHLQVTLVKNPERNEFQDIRDLIQTTAQRVGDSRLETINTSARYTTGASVHSSRRGGGPNENPYDSEMTLSNLSLQNTPSELNNINRSMLRTAVLFDNNQADLDDGDKRIIDSFISRFTESDTDVSNSRVHLIGHASRPGTRRANRRLVNRRIASVMNYLREKNFPDIDTRITTPENRSDEMAERYPDTENNAEAFRRVEIVVGEGELQNTVSHEFGHVFGLLDEYVTDASSPQGTGTPAGTVVGHSGLSENIGAGRVQSERSDNMMSLGNEVRAQHYGPFGWALRQLTSKNWRIF